MTNKKRRRKFYTQYKAIERVLVQAALVVLTSAASGDAYASLGDGDGSEPVVDSLDLEESWHRAKTSDLQPRSTIPLAKMLAIDESRRIHDVLVNAVAGSLEQMTPLARSCSVCTLATSQDLELRVVAALSLESSLPILGATWCIEHLARDPEPIVRRVAIHAANCRRSESSDRFVGLLHSLQDDPDRAVAVTARQMAGGGFSPARGNSR